MSMSRSSAASGPRLKQAGAKRMVGVGTLALFGLASMLFCYTFLFWNVVVIYEHFHAGDTPYLFKPTFWPLQWSAATFRPLAVDLSAQTPFKLSLFFTLLFVSSYRSLAGRLDAADLRARSGYLPFFRTLETTFVQLGLAGSIWGFLLIGFGLANRKEATDAMPILLGAFGTALLSTFTGVVLAFVAAPVVRFVWRWLHDVPSQAANAAQGLSAEVERLRGALTNAVGQVVQLRGAFEKSDLESSKLRGSLAATALSLEDLHKRTDSADPSKLNAKVENIEAWTGAIGAELKAIHQAMSPIRDHLGAMQGDVAATRSAATSLAAAGAGLVPTLADLAASMRGMAEAVKSLGAKIDNMASSQLRLLETAERQAVATGELASYIRASSDQIGQALGQFETKLGTLLSTARFPTPPWNPYTDSSRADSPSPFNGELNSRAGEHSSTTTVSGMATESLGWPPRQETNISVAEPRGPYPPGDNGQQGGSSLLGKIFGRKKR